MYNSCISIELGLVISVIIITEKKFIFINILFIAKSF